MNVISDPQVLNLARRAWTVSVTAPDEAGDVEITIDELPEFMVAGPPGPGLNAQFWDALSSYLASFTARGAIPPSAPPARTPLGRGPVVIGAVTLFADEALAATY